jgi:hypothetical protein
MKNDGISWYFSFAGIRMTAPLFCGARKTKRKKHFGEE